MLTLIVHLILLSHRPDLNVWAEDNYCIKNKFNKSMAHGPPVAPDPLHPEAKYFEMTT